MPTDENRRKYFMSDTRIPQRYYYEVESWVREKDWPERRQTIQASELSTVDFMTMKIEKEDDKEISYITIWGPFPDWDFVEGILAYDYGEEGSRVSNAA